MNPDGEHRTELVRGLVSAALLVGLLAGVPTLLIVGVGWPLPHGVPSGSEAAASIKTGAIPPSMILKAISLVLWVLWLQALAGMGIELWAHFHGRIAPRVVLVPRFMQSLAARIVGTALVITFAIQQPGSALADNQELLTPTAAEAAFDQPWSSSLEQADIPVGYYSDTNAARDGEDIDTEPLIHTVGRRDSLRVLAERYLGDANRWDEVFVLNQGQTQDVGGSLTDPARLQAGWKLVMPADAHLPEPTNSSFDKVTPRNHRTDQPVAGSADTDHNTITVQGGDTDHNTITVQGGDTDHNTITVQGGDTDHNTITVQGGDTDHNTITVQGGDTLWGLAAQHLDDPEKWVEIFNANRNIIEDPGLIVPGWQLQLPEFNIQDDATQLARPLADLEDDSYVLISPPTEFEDDTYELARPPAEFMGQTTSVMAYAANKPTVVVPANPIHSDDQPVPNTQTMFAIGGLGVFATSLGWVLARLRRTQRRRLPSGRVPLPSTNEAVHLERQLQAAADPDSALFLDASLRVMSSRIDSHAPPQVVGVIQGPGGVSVLLESPAEAPYGFSAGKDDMAWKMPRGAAVEELLTEAEGVSAPLPTLVSIGKKDGDEFLVNLEHMTALNLEGNQESIKGLCATMATQLATSHLADDLTVLCVGFGQDLSVFERVEHVPDVTAAIEQVERQKRQNRALLGNCPPSAETRFGSNDDIWCPTVVLIPGQLTGNEASSLLDVCGIAVCVVAHRLVGAAWTGKFDHAGLFLEPIGLQVEPHVMSESATAVVTELTAAAKDTQGAVLNMPSASRPVESEVKAPVVASLQVDLEVRVIGSVDVLGTAHSFASRRALDLVAYLAFHPEGADRDQLKAHVWPPDKPPSESTFSNTLSRARKALGTTDDGEPYLPRVSSEGIYRLRPEVGTDVSRFEALISEARSGTSEQSREHLTAALDLVRGTPFTGGAGDMYRWADFGLRTRIDCLVDDAAHGLAELCLEVGDSEGARRAAVISLRLVGVCEQCYRWRLLAAAENPTEVRQVMAELVGLLKQESGQAEADHLISPDLLELYERLMPSRPAFS